MDGNPPKAEGFNCPACDWPVPVRSMGHATTVVCPSCGTIVDASNPRLRIIQRFQEQLLKPLLPLGSRGKFRKTEYLIIGFLVRSDASGQFAWEEYLLCNPYKGFAWLTHSDGHWSFLQTIKDFSDASPGSSLTYKHRTFRKFLEDQPRVVSVVGEFYWEVSTGDQSSTIDFIAPPYLLSCEKGDNEIIWSYGIYLQPAEVEQAFGLLSPLLRRTGVAMNQPNHWRQRVHFTALAGGIAACFMIALHTRIASENPALRYEENFIFQPGLPSSTKITTGAFQVTGKTTNVAVDVRAEVSNDWLDIGMTLTNLATGRDKAVDAEVAFYQGTDSDGFWREGSKSERYYFVGVEPGTYLLSGDVTLGSAAAGNFSPPTPYTIKVTQSVSMAGNVVLAILALFAVPVICLFGAMMFEAARWNQSSEGDN